VTYYSPKPTIGRPSESGISAYKNKNYSNSNTIPTGNSKSTYNNSNYTTPSSSNFSGLVKKYLAVQVLVVLTIGLLELLIIVAVQVDLTPLPLLLIQAVAIQHLVAMLVAIAVA